MEYHDYQPEAWCGARPCGECDGLMDCVLVELDQPSRNVLGILKKLAELDARKGGRKRKG